ncbi:MAG: hypothetical protein R3D32_05455 [Nitratireductor sp.]
MTDFEKPGGNIRFFLFLGCHVHNLECHNVDTGMLMGRSLLPNQTVGAAIEVGQKGWRETGVQFSPWAFSQMYR